MVPSDGALSSHLGPSRPPTGQLESKSVRVYSRDGGKSCGFGRGSRSHGQHKRSTPARWIAGPGHLSPLLGAFLARKDPVDLGTPGPVGRSAAGARAAAAV